MSGSAPIRRGGALRRVAAAMRPEGRRLALASLLAASATLCAIGLLAVSGWLISRASQMPPVFTLTVAIVAVRGFGIGRGFFRYAERLVAHDAVLRGLTALRVAVWSPLERLAPHGLDAFRRGDLLARFVADVDAMQEFALRVVLPVVTAVLAGGVSVVVTWWLLPAAGAVLLTVLILGATVVPLVTVLAGGRAERETAPTRGELFAQVRTLLVGAADLLAAGSAHAELHRTLDTDAELLRSPEAGRAQRGGRHWAWRGPRRDRGHRRTAGGDHCGRRRSARRREPRGGRAAPVGCIRSGRNVAELPPSPSSECAALRSGSATCSTPRHR